MGRRITSILLLIHLSCLVSVQAQLYPFVHYTPEDGLVSTRARMMFQDSKGRLYIATFGGLSIYDGSRFINFTVNNGLADNLVNQVVEMGEDSIWIIPNANRIHCLVKGKIKDFITTDKFYPLINQLIKSSNGLYYALCDEGLYRFENGHFTKIVLEDQNGRPLNRYFNKGKLIGNKLFIVTDPAVAYWPSPSFLIIYDLVSGKACIGKKPPEVYDVTASPAGEILLATNAGLRSLDMQALKHNQVIFTNTSSYRQVSDVVANYLYVDREHNLWLTASDGVYSADVNGRVKKFATENGLPVNLHYSVFQDREHIMWFMNEQTGISKLSTSNIAFYKEIRPGFVTDGLYASPESDSIWFVDQAHKKVLLEYPGGSAMFGIQLSPRWLNRFIPGKVTNYLVGDYEVYTCKYPVSGNQVIPEPVCSYRDSFAGVPMVNNPVPDHEGNLLFVNDRINVVYPDARMESFPLGYYADQFFLTADNILWVPTRQKKLLIFHLHPGRPGHYFELLKTIDSNIPERPRSITIDPGGLVWIGTRDLGLFSFEVDKEYNILLKQNINDKKGLSDNCILSLHNDTEGNIWACSPVGLDKLQLKNNRWVVKNITRGNNIYRHIFKIHTTRNGDHWALSSTGIIKISPPPTTTPQNFNVRILFTEIRAGKDTLLALAERPALSYKKNDLVFQWAAPAFADEKQTVFSYRLEGSGNTDWSESSRESMVRFVNLPPGKYTLNVKAIFPNGLYPDAETRYTFVILPPWWQSWWFRTLIILLLMVAGILLVRSYVRKKLQKQRIWLEKRQAIEKERARIASDMHDDLGAGLSTIRFLSEKVRRNPATEVNKREIEKIASISNDMVESMNEIIWAMNEKNDSLEDLLYYTRAYAREYCEEHQMECSFDFPESIPAKFVSGDLRRNVFLVVKESLHNIVKYAGASKVDISVHINTNLSVTIRDNGKGFEITGYEGNPRGNGLRNMRRRMESIGGRLDLTAGQGVAVTMEVPLNEK